jgi:hypothetical protein
MVDDRAPEVALLLARALNERQCDSLQELMAQLVVRSGAALLARLG